MAHVAFTLPWPPSVNRLWTHSRGGVYKSKTAREYEWQVAAAIAEQGVPQLDGDVAVSLTLYRPARRGDTDNYSKALLDSLQGRVYANDKQIAELHVYRGDDKRNPRVDVEIWTVNG